MYVLEICWLLLLLHHVKVLHVGSLHVHDVVHVGSYRYEYLMYVQKEVLESSSQSLYQVLLYILCFARTGRSFLPVLIELYMYPVESLPSRSLIHAVATCTTLLVQYIHVHSTTCTSKTFYT